MASIPVSVDKRPLAVAARNLFADRLSMRRTNGIFVVWPFLAYGDATTTFASPTSPRPW